MKSWWPGWWAACSSRILLTRSTTAAGASGTGGRTATGRHEEEQGCRSAAVGTAGTANGDWTIGTGVAGRADWMKAR